MPLKTGDADVEAKPVVEQHEDERAGVIEPEQAAVAGISGGGMIRSPTVQGPQVWLHDRSREIGSSSFYARVHSANG